MIVHLTAEEIRRWLQDLGQSRAWLADQVGASLGTVNNWFTQGAFPLWAQKSISHLRELHRPNIVEPRLTRDEWRLIERAASAAGYKTTDEFVVAALLAEAARLASAPPALRAAEEPTEYRTTSEHPPD